MSFFDIFTNNVAKDAANDQISGINSGYSLASDAINKGISSLNTNYTSALQPYLTNYSNANAGTTQLANVLGLNGTAGTNSALSTLENTPGYKFQLQAGDDAVNAQAAATGTNASGNQLLALSKYNQGLASTTYNNYVSQLQPYLTQSEKAATGIASTYTGLGNATASQYNRLGDLGYTAETDKGNAKATATLAQNQANQNQWNALTGAASAALSVFSDERLKEFIEPVGELYDGTNIYRYNYKGDPVPRIGVMAQEVEKVNPGAVTEIGGFKAVNYAKATDRAASLARFLDKAA